MQKNIELESITNGIDALREATDRKWGKNYLRLKVGPETRFKWDVKIFYLILNMSDKDPFSDVSKRRDSRFQAFRDFFSGKKSKPKLGTSDGKGLGSSGGFTST